MSSDALTGNRVALEHRAHSHTPFYVVWGALLAITAIEVALAYERLQPVRMLSILLALSIVKAALIISWFMHMKYELTRMRRLMMISLCVCLALMCVFFADAFRIINLGVK
ncbi:MAG: cytochrome C oxidase subunit IV family protein [Acidobacteriia bacterium]|nr:cytochrome C oxidase subunit IV family protein [Terriglobia bacterium]